MILQTMLRARARSKLNLTLRTLRELFVAFKAFMHKALDEIVIPHIRFIVGATRVNCTEEEEMDTLMKSRETISTF